MALISGKYMMPSIGQPFAMIIKHTGSLIKATTRPSVSERRPFSTLQQIIDSNEDTKIDEALKNIMEVVVFQICYSLYKWKHFVGRYLEKILQIKRKCCCSLCLDVI